MKLVWEVAVALREVGRSGVEVLVIKTLDEINEGEGMSALDAISLDNICHGLLLRSLLRVGSGKMIGGERIN